MPFEDKIGSSFLGFAGHNTNSTILTLLTISYQLAQMAGLFAHLASHILRSVGFPYRRPLAAMTPRWP